MEHAFRGLTRCGLLLEVGVFGFGLFEDGEVGVGVFPEGEEVLGGGFGFGGVARQYEGAAEL